MTSHVEQQVAARIAAARQRIAEQKRMREEFAAARAVGVGRRHAAKLRHQAAAEVPPGPQTTEDTPMPAAIRRTVCPACRQQRPARLVTTVVVATNPYDVLRCLDEACGLMWCAPPERPRTAPAAA